MPEIETRAQSLKPLRHDWTRSLIARISLILLLSAASLTILLRGLQRQQRSALETIQAEYRALSKHVARLGIQAGPSTTPIELASILLRRLESDPTNGPGVNLLMRIEQSLPQFTSAFIASRYGAAVDRVFDKKTLQRNWRILDRSLWMAFLVTRIKSFGSHTGESQGSASNIMPRPNSEQKGD